MTEVATLTPLLNTGLTALGFDVDAFRRDRLLAFVALLQKWNRTYNLTAIREPAEMVSHHLLDSLAILPYVQESALARRRIAGSEPFRLADVGSGAGLPGLVLAIMQPEWQVRSIDAVDKKAAFQRQVCIELGLRNVEVVSGRVEDQSPESADAVISRAFADLSDFVALAGHLVVPGGVLLAMKGQMPADEISVLPVSWQTKAVIPIEVPGLNAQRHLIVLERE